MRGKISQEFTRAVCRAIINNDDFLVELDRLDTQNNFLDRGPLVEYRDHHRDRGISERVSHPNWTMTSSSVSKQVKRESFIRGQASAAQYAETDAELKTLDTGGPQFAR